MTAATDATAACARGHVEFKQVRGHVVHLLSRTRRHFIHGIRTRRRSGVCVYKNDQTVSKINSYAVLCDCNSVCTCVARHTVVAVAVALQHVQHTYYSMERNNIYKKCVSSPGLRITAAAVGATCA